MTDVEHRIRDFIIGKLMFNGDPSSLELDTPLLTDGIIDSLGLTRLVAFVETEFDIAIENDLLRPANFESLRAIVKMVEEVGGE